MRALIVGEQLRRRVPGGIGTYVRGLFQGLRSLRDDGVERASATHVPGAFVVDATVWWSRGGGAPPAGAHERQEWLPGPVLTRLWDRGWRTVPRGFDICHATSLAVPPSRGRQPPLTVFVHDLAWRDVPAAYPARGRAWHEAALHRAVERAHLLLVPSEATAVALRAEAAAERIVVTGEGCDQLPLAPRWDGDYLLAVATLEPRKNLAALVDAYARIRKSFPTPWSLKIVGAAGWGDSGIVPTDGVELVGHIDDDELARLYGGARAFAYVPLTEGYGLPPIEAMRAGVPVVSSNVPSLEGALDAAEVVDPTSVDAIAEGLYRAATDEQHRAALVAAGRAHAAGRTWKATAQRHVEVWRRWCPQ